LTFSEAIFPGVKENYREAFIRRERRENREGKTAGKLQRRMLSITSQEKGGKEKG